ncbi:UNVERIFIED_CONTAM: hypothetical protein HDU68_011266 [Siphonaria sp. JEL0065]|nr:hypothetical protein HDU68_011266 [Siphonaria sp. JEL0065]
MKGSLLLFSLFLALASANHASSRDDPIPQPPPQVNITLYGPDAINGIKPAVLTGNVFKIYNIFYGDFSKLEQDRINNYAKHVSDESTVPNRWSIAKSYYDAKGRHIDKIKLERSVNVSFPAIDYIDSTTYYFEPLAAAKDTVMAKILESFIGKGKPLGPFDSNGIYCLIAAPEIFTMDWDRRRRYDGYHLSYNTTIDDKDVSLRHVFIPLVGRDKTHIDYAHCPNGDTGRRMVDVAVAAFHHQIIEQLTNPVPNTAWVDSTIPVDYSPSGVADVCDLGINQYKGLRFTESTSQGKGRWYNTIINGQIYGLQDQWAYDKSNAQGCYSSVDKVGEFIGPSKAKKPVAVSDGIKNFTGIDYLPCRAYYGYYQGRYYGGSTVPGSKVCNIYLNGPSYASDGLQYTAPFSIVDNFHLVSTNGNKAANYHWANVNETNAFRAYGDSIGPAPLTVSATDDSVFVVISDQWSLDLDENNRYTLVDAGAYYFCRAQVNGTWYIGETMKFQSTCDFQDDKGTIVQVAKDANVHYLLRRAFCDKEKSDRTCSEDGRVATCSDDGLYSFKSCSGGKSCKLNGPADPVCK